MSKERNDLSAWVALALWGGFGFIALMFTLFVLAFLLRPPSTSLTTVVLTFAGMMVAGAVVVSAVIRYAETALRARMDMLNQRDALQRKLNHEVRTLLNVIVGYTELAREESNAGRPMQMGRYLGEIENTVMQLLRLANDALDLARIGEGKVPIRQQPVNLCALLHDLRAATEPLLTKKGNRLVVDCDDSAVDSDYTRVYQVLLNLISNANRFTPGGEIAVAVRGPGEVMPGFVDVEVTDAGPGIPVDDLGRIFEPFEQSPAGEGDGSGLGLTVSREFARALGGDVLVRSMIGEGACFTLRLPVQAGHEPGGRDPG